MPLTKSLTNWQATPEGETPAERNQRLLDEIVERSFQVFATPPEMSISEWADSERQLSRESSSAFGQWETSLNEPLRGIMDAISDPEIEEIVVMSASQVGKTEAILNAIGYHIQNDPSPILCVLPNEAMAMSMSRDRIAPMVRDTPALKGLVSDPKSRSTGNTVMHKNFPGGHITLASAQSPANLAARSCRLVLLDEVDRFPASSGSEGDPVSLAKRRAVSFWNRKIVLTSTPTIKGESRIEAAYETSDQRKYWVPCKSCGEFQTLDWSNVVWVDGKPETARYRCGECDERWTDIERKRAITKGEWRSLQDSTGVAGFHLSGLYSPFVTLGQAASEFLSAKKHPEILRTWVNTYLSESWEEDSDQIDTHFLIERRETYSDTIPDGVLVLTSGVDVQADRLECLVVGHSHADELYFIDQRIFYGSPANLQVWDELSDYLRSSWAHPNGKDLRIVQTLVDSGYETQAVYQFCKRMAGNRVNASKGIGGSGRPAVGRPSKANSANCNVFPIGTNTLKEVLFARLRVKEPGPAFWHIPDHFDEEFCHQLTAEKAVKRYSKGIPRIEYIKLRPRNEALDLAVLNLAAFAMLNVNTNMVEKRLQDQRKPEPKQKPRTRRSWVSGVSQKRRF
jgi:phage terminase large subunit GpA-like protein